MHPTIIKRKEKADSLRAGLAEKYKHRMASFGQEVSFIHPALPEPFPKLRHAIDSSKRCKEFSGQFYYIHTRERHIEQLVTISQYYKLVFNNVAHKLHDLSEAIMSSNMAASDIQRVFQSEHKVREATGQPYVHLGQQIQQLKAAVAAYLFTSRSVFDCVATLFQFLYGVDAEYFDSFADFINALKSGRVADPLMASFVEGRMTWFFRLRDLPDFVTHFGALDLGLFKTESGKLIIRVQSEFDIEELLNGATAGINEFLAFFDNHFSELLRT